MVYVDYSPVCYTVAIIIALFTVGLILFYINKKRQGPDYSGRGKDMPNRVIGAFIVIMIVSNSIFISSIFITTHDRYLEYGLEITSDVDGVIVVPVSRYQPLESKLDVTMGDGNTKLLDTEHGRAIQVEFNGPVDVRGELMTLRSIDDWKFTMPTTDSTHQWIYYESSISTNSSCFLELILTYRLSNGSSHMLELRGPLSPGWNIYKVMEGGVLL